MRARLLRNNRRGPHHHHALAVDLTLDELKFAMECFERGHGFAQGPENKIVVSLHRVDQPVRINEGIK